MKKKDIFLLEETSTPLLVEEQPPTLLVEEQSSPGLIKDSASNKSKPKPSTPKKQSERKIGKEKKETIEVLSEGVEHHAKQIEEGYKSKYFKKLKGEIAIPDGVIRIGNEAFMECDKITSVTIPNSVRSIGRFAFAYCSDLVSLTIGSGVKSIDMHAFTDCINLASVTIPYGVVSIGISAFSGCSRLTSVTLPDSITDIQRWAFKECYALNKIIVPSGTKDRFLEMDGLEDLSEYIIEVNDRPQKRVSVRNESPIVENKSSKLKNWLHRLLEMLD